MQVQALLAEMAMVEEEIIWLERKVEELKMGLYHEKKLTKERKMKHQSRLPRANHLLRGQASPSGLTKDLQVRTRSQHYEEFRRERKKSFRRASAGSASELLSFTPAASSGRLFSKLLRTEESGEKNCNIILFCFVLWFWLFLTEEFYEKPRKQTCRIPKHCRVDKETSSEKPNVLSEELIKCLIGIFLDINQASHDREGSAVVPKLGLSCINSKGFAINQNASKLDPYGILPDLDGSIRDIGPYKNLIQITRSSLDINRFTECKPALRKLRLIPGSLNKQYIVT